MCLGYFLSVQCADLCICDCVSYSSLCKLNSGLGFGSQGQFSPAVL